MATFDVIFIGGGPAGYVGAIRCSQLGLTTAVIERDKLNDEITRQVVEAHTRVHSLEDQLIHARKALEAAEQSLKLAGDRRAFAVGEVLENVLAEQELTRTRFDYLGVVTEHNRAQFLLRRAIGAEATSPARRK